MYSFQFKDIFLKTPLSGGQNCLTLSLTFKAERKPLEIFQVHCCFAASRGHYLVVGELSIKWGS